MQKSSCSLTIVFALLFFIAGVGMSFAAWDGTSTKKPATATIDKKEYYLIENEANLAWFRDSVNAVKGSSAINAKLRASLDMGGKLFVPIAAGSAEVTFGGIFDGNGFAISNLYMNSDELGKIPNEFCAADKPMCNAQNVGLIGVLSGGTVKNLNLIDVNIEASASKGVGGNEDNPVSVGPVAAFQKSGTVDNCYVSGKVLTSGRGNGIGGLVGNIWTGNITNSLSTVDVLVSGNESYVGGIAGYARKGGKATIDACAYDGNIIINSGDGVAGGVVGFFEAGELAVSRVYYDTDVITTGIGKQTDTLTVEGTFSSVKNVNSSKVVCDLNGGEIKDNVCTKDGTWSVGDVHIVLNGITRDNNDGLVYGIYFDANGGSFPEDAQTVKYLKLGEQITADEIAIPVRGDTIFGGWALTPDATEPVADLGTVVSSATVYAYWMPMLEITFDANGGEFTDGTATKKKNVAKGAAIDIDGIELPTTYTDGEKKYYFAGWGAAADATEPAALGNASAATTFYAIWTEVPTFTVTFNTLGYGTTFVTVLEGETVAKPTDPVAEGYTFEGWYAERSLATKFDFAAAIKESKAAFAKWTPKKYTITYELDGGTNNKGNPESYTIETATIKLKAPTKKGYIFEGWYYDKKFSKSATRVIRGSSGDKKFYAKWKIRTYTIIYMAGAFGREVVAADEKKFDEPLKLKGASYTREGYVQKGWSTEDGGPKKYDLGANYSVNAGLILYPYWESASSSALYAGVNRLSAFSVAVQGRSLDISCVKAGAKWMVYDMQGSLVAQGVAQSGSSHVDLPKAGNYVVRMDNQFRTVRVR